MVIVQSSRVYWIQQLKHTEDSDRSMPNQIFTITQVLEDKWWIACTAFAAAIIATPVFRYIAYKKGFVDKPDTILKPHVHPTAYLGGLGICVGLLAGLIVYLPSMSDLGLNMDNICSSIASKDFEALFSNPLWNVIFLFLAFIVITMVGVTDDIRNLKPLPKFAGQICAAALLLAGGAGTRILTVFLDPMGIQLPLWALIPLTILTCLVMVLSTCNATNLLDGLDGLCGGVTAIITLGFLALAVYLATWGHAPAVDELRIALCLAMAGAIFGFLPYNAPPATIFMGDAGSMLLGFFVAAMMGLFAHEGPARWVLASGLIFGLPILDTALALARRIRAGVSIFSGDRSHLYDQLVDKGLSVTRVVLLFYVISIAFAVMGVVIAIALRTRYAIVVYAALLLVIWTIFSITGMISPKKDKDPNPVQPPNDP